MSRALASARGFAGLALAGRGLALAGFKPETAVVGSPVADFCLRGVNNQVVSLANYSAAKGFTVVFACNHCPFARLYFDWLNALNQKCQALRVPLLAINSMDTVVYADESFRNMQRRAEAEQFTFSYLHDARQTVGRDFQVQHTPQTYVIWKEGAPWKIKYCGAVDDNGAAPAQVKNVCVAQAVDDLLVGKPVSTPQTDSFGCAIFSASSCSCLTGTSSSAGARQQHSSLILFPRHSMKLKLLTLVLCGCFSTILSAHTLDYGPVKLRHWTVAGAPRTLDGAFLIYKNNNVYIEELNHRVSHYPLASLSAADQAFALKKHVWVTKRNAEFSAAHAQPLATRPIAYGPDGFAVHGPTEPDGLAMTTLDAYHGHYYGPAGVYHYPGTAAAPYMIANMVGQVTEDATTQIIPQAQARPVRPGQLSLRGATITGCGANTAGNGYAVAHTLNTQSYSLNYNWTTGGLYTFNLVAPTGTTTSAYTGPAPCAVPTATRAGNAGSAAVAVYPNPAGQTFSLALGPDIAARDVRDVAVYDQKGALAYRTQQYPQTIGSGPLAPGVYVVKI